MSSYNLLNGKHTAENAQLLRGILRDEWGFNVAIMTDWFGTVTLVAEIKAGNNIKMPLGFGNYAELALQSYNNGELTIENLTSGYLSKNNVPMRKL